MANTAIEILNAAKKQKQNPAKNTGKQPKSPIRENLSNASIDDLTSMYFGDDSVTEGIDYTMYPNGEKRAVYDAHEEMKQLQNEQQVINTNSKMPSVILEEMMRNPLQMPTQGIDVEENIMDEQLQAKTMDIINKLESRDRRDKTYVQPQPTEQPARMITEATYGNAVSTDNGIVRLIEDVLDRKLKQYATGIINETRRRGESSPSMKFMRLGETFTFMDDADNVYECKMVYKGKGKVKQRK